MEDAAGCSAQLTADIQESNKTSQAKNYALQETLKEELVQRGKENSWGRS